MNDFVPSEKFVDRTMEAVFAHEARKAGNTGKLFRGVAVLLVQAGAILAGCGIAIANLIRIYYTVFAPVLSH